MKLTRETDYAIRIALCLSARDTHLAAREIAEQMKVTHTFTLKILHKLTRAGFVKSVQGVAGGYKLVKKPDKISLLEIVEIIEGPLAINACLQEQYICERLEKERCPVHNTLEELNGLIRGELDKRLISNYI